MLGLRAKYPPVAVEIGEGYATAVRVQRGGGRLRLAEWNRVELPLRRASAGDIGGEIELDDDVRLRLGDLLEPLGRLRRLSLVIPDSAVRSFFVELENPAAGGKELRDMITFKLSKLVPINLDGAALAYQRLRARENGGAHYLAILTSRRISGAYEDFFEARGTHVGLIETAFLASANLFAPVLEAESGDFALLRIGVNYFSLALFLDGKLAFSRTRRRTSGSIPYELRTLNLFAQDKLGSDGFRKVYLQGPGASDGAVEAALEDAGFNPRRLDLEEVADLPPSLRDRMEEQGTLLAAVGAAGRS